ncbi:hypothetical protein PAI11_32730 [Patulibacter medicamentivorans]|uniref:Uncharacterized protein n=1 Tax=Patulibacter medicamentivorans TaxID=1097667 RepID=H0E8V9_9ACTN|nr:hypothetical protein [Patulibacter medicamentivorans]EHN09914.1 hypothetical protein PAI11_32730 [Patulibacter medicamentivorans]
MFSTWLSPVRASHAFAGVGQPLHARPRDMKARANERRFTITRTGS